MRGEMMSHGDIKLREVVIHYSRLRVHTNTYLRTCTGAVHVLSVSQSVSPTVRRLFPRIREAEYGTTRKTHGRQTVPGTRIFDKSLRKSFGYTRSQPSAIVQCYGRGNTTVYLPFHDPNDTNHVI